MELNNRFRPRSGFALTELQWRRSPDLVGIRWQLTLLAFIVVAHGYSSSVYAQAPVDRQFIQQQIDDLSNPSYRARQLARWRLEQHPALAVEVIGQALESVEYNTAAQLVDLLSILATHGDVAISVKARETLAKNANRVSSVGKLADNAVRAIADLQEEQAIEVLLHHHAKIGTPDELRFNLNARVVRGNELAIRIDDDFTGSDETIEWIQFLQSVETVFLEGPSIDSRYFRAIARMPKVKNVKLKHVSVSIQDLEQLKKFPDLEILELNYADVGDDTLSTLAALPISQSLRLYGTKITPQGAQQLAKQLDGIDIYCGRGGYLGVATHPANTMVSQVIPGSGAARAGIREGDELLQVDGVDIKNFEDLRTELGKHGAGDQLRITARRRFSSNPTDMIELDFQVTLGEDPS